jgi:predicted Zn-dependent protease
MVLRSPLTNPAVKPGVSLNVAAAAALRAGNVMTARQMLQDRLLQDPEDANALELLAEIAASHNSVEEATILLRRAVAADPSPERRLTLVQHLQRFSNPPLALAEIEKLPANVRNTFDVKGVEASIQGVLGHHDRQIRLYQEMARERPDATGLWVSLGNALKTVGRTAEAVKALQRALRAVPTFG